MKTLFATILFTATVAMAQYAPSGSGSTNAAAEINGKLNTQFGSGAPSALNCTIGRDVYIDTTAIDFYLCSVTGTPGTWVKKGTGTVTTMSFAGGLISVASPTTAPALTVAGTSGGVPYFSGATTWASSGLLGNAQFVLGGGSGNPPTSAAMTGDLSCSGANCTVVGIGGTAAATIKARSIGFAFGDPAGTTLTTGTVGYVTVPYSCTLAAWNILVDAGTATVTTWKIATGTAIPTVSNSISTSGVAISSGTAVHSTTMTDFTTTTVSANDIIAFNISAVATAKYLFFGLQCNQ